MEKNSINRSNVSHSKQITDPLMLKAYTEALKQKHRWQASIDELIREVLGLKSDQPFDPSAVPSAEEIRKEMSRYIPENEKLSDLLIALREE
ncbi:MAG: hypothetical protein WCO26_07315 [Deltaproteobacteria bacterium]